jgi:protein SCO1/2
MRLVARIATVAMLAAMVPVSGWAQGGYSANKPIGTSAQQLPAYLAHAGIEQRLGKELPLNSVYTDETGKTGPLSSWLDGKPIVIAEVYYKCVLLCPEVMHGLATALKSTTLTPGKDYEVLVFSIDPTDKPSDAIPEKTKFLSDAGWTGNAQAGNAVHFLTSSEASIQAISNATGFHFVMVPGTDGKMDQFAHSSVIMFATPDGRMSKYLAGVSYATRDMRMALLDASEKKISNPVDLLILYCCSYNPAVGKYSVSIVRILGLAGMVSLAIVIGMIFLLTRKPKSQRT